MVTVITKQHIIDKGNNVSNVQYFDSSEDFYSMEGDYSNGVGGVEISDKKTPTGGGAKEESKMRGIELPEFVAVSSKSTKEDKLKTKDGAMSTTTKVLIGLGIALVLGTTIYFITKKK